MIPIGPKQPFTVRLCKTVATRRRAIVMIRFKRNTFYVRIRMRRSDDDRPRKGMEREMRSVDVVFMGKLLENTAAVKDVRASLDFRGTIEDRPAKAGNRDDAALPPVDLVVDDSPRPVETTRLMEKGRRLMAELSAIGETLSSESKIFKRLADRLADGSNTDVGNGSAEPVNGKGQERI